jgi:hypothetical protein
MAKRPHRLGSARPLRRPAEPASTRRAVDHLQTYGNQKTLRPGTKGLTFRGATRIRRYAALWPTGRALATVLWPPLLPPIGAARYRWRPAPEPTGGPWKPGVRSGGSRVHSLPPPRQLPPTAGSLRRRPGGTRPDHSPYSECGPECRGDATGLSNDGLCRGTRRERGAPMTWWRLQRAS